MKELIEKQAVIDALLSKMDTIDDKPEVVLGLAVAAGMIKDMPSALEQKPCEDCISRQAAIRAIEALQLPIMREESNYYQFKFSGMSEAREAVENLPSVTPQPKTGLWITL